MPVITLHTEINAPIERCFLLSLSVDLHKLSASQTHEEVVAGVRHGLMKLHEQVTWRAKHFGVRFNMTSAITAYECPTYFVSRMVKGPFKKLYHQHLFSEKDGKTLMTDIFELKAPFGFLGNLAEKWFLVSYMERFLITRNRILKQTAENSGWEDYVSGS